MTTCCPLYKRMVQKRANKLLTVELEAVAVAAAARVSSECTALLARRLSSMSFSITSQECSDSSPNLTSHRYSRSYINN